MSEKLSIQKQYYPTYQDIFATHFLLPVDLLHHCRGHVLGHGTLQGDKFCTTCDCNLAWGIQHIVCFSILGDGQRKMLCT